VGFQQNVSANESGGLGIQPGRLRVAFELNYNELINLDAEDLAAAGIKHAYAKPGPALLTYVQLPAALRVWRAAGDNHLTLGRF
jgi:hypothetical protein